jgi:hypothetical protein
MDDRSQLFGYHAKTNNPCCGENIGQASPALMADFNPRLAEASRTFGRLLTNETARRQKRVTLIRPLSLAVRNPLPIHGPAGNETTIEVTVLDFSRNGIGFISPRPMAPRDRFTVTLRTALGALTMFYSIRRAIPVQSSQWRVGSELLGTLGNARATRPEGIIWALMRGSCPGCGN